MAGLFSNEQRFVWDIDALQEILRYPTQPHLLDASVILRRLLTDSGEPLLHKVARGRDFKPRFVVSGKSGDPELAAKLFEGLVFAWRNPAFSHYAGSVPTRDLGLDEFLAEVVTRIGKTRITVKELINYVANVGGGVHQGSPRKKDNAEAIHTSAGQIMINGNPYPLDGMANIAKITVAALYPLYLRIRA